MLNVCQKPEVCSIQKGKSSQPATLLCQIFEEHASTQWTDSLSPPPVAVTMPTSFWKEIQRCGEFLTFNYLFMIVRDTNLMTLRQEQYQHKLGGLRCPAWRWGFKAGKHPPTPQQEDCSHKSFETLCKPVTSSTESPCHFIQQQTTILNFSENAPAYAVTHAWINRVCSSFSEGSKSKWHCTAWWTLHRFLPHSHFPIPLQPV